MKYRILAVCALILASGLGVKAQKPDVTAMEDQYKLCSKHSIPADKCTDAVYKELSIKRDALLDPKTSAALEVFKDVKWMFKNPKSAQVTFAIVTETMGVCIRVSSQNSLGGMTEMEFASPGTEEAKDRGIRTSLNGNEPFRGVCQKGTLSLKWLPHTNVTAKVNQALKEEE